MSSSIDDTTPNPDRTTNPIGAGVIPPNRPFEARRDRHWTLRDLAIRLFYRIRLFLFCLFLGLVAGTIAAVVSKPVHTADTLLIVLLGSESAAVQDSLNLTNTQISIDGLKAVQSEIQIIQADDVIRSATEAVGVGKLYPGLTRPRYLGLLPSLDGDEQISAAIERFKAGLRAEAQGNSNVIRVAFAHSNRDLAIAAVQAVTTAYLAQRRSIYANNNISVLSQEIRRYSAHLAQIEAELLMVRRQYDVLDMAQDIVLATNRLDGIIQRQNQVRERRVAVETEIIAVRANLAAQPPNVLDFRETTNNTGNDEARNTLVRLMQERTHLATQYNDSYPGLRELDRKIAAVRGQIGTGSQSLYFSERTIRNPAVDVLNNRLASLEVENEALDQQLVELDAQSGIAAERIKSLREADAKLHSLQLNRDVAEGIYRQLSLRQPGAIFNDDAITERSANVRVAQPPTAPLQGRRLTSSFAIGGGFLGFLLGVTAVVVATMLQQVYILPADAERDLRLLNLGDVDTGMGLGAQNGLGHGYGAVASNLLGISVDGRSLAMVQVASPSEPDRKAEVARALGTEFAREFAMRTLILDLRDNAQSSAKGPAEGATLDPAPAIPVATTEVEDLWVSVGARRALFGDRGGMLARAWQTFGTLRQTFDIVLVIAPSDLSQPMVHRLARSVDANLLVLHAERTRGPAAARFREMILEAGGNLAGFVFVDRKFYVPRWLYRRL
jgi:uncharacterized protein involved in exopolysaccharide biosynthesis